jgi:flagellar hook-associated protein 3 FlgL
MSYIPSNIARVPNLLLQRLSLEGIARTNTSIFRTQTELSTGRAVLRPSDDAARSVTIGVLNDRLAVSEQLTRNFTHARASLNVLDNALGDLSDLGLQAKSIAQEQLGFSASASERQGQAAVLDQIISGVYTLSRREGVAGYVFGGSTPSGVPLTEFKGGYRFTGSSGGLLTDLGPATGAPITVGADALGAVSARVRGDRDLNPRATGATRIADLAGARSLGVALGTIEFSFDNGARTRIDLAGADDLQGVAARITGAVRAYEQASGVTVLGPGGVTVANGALRADVVPGVAPAPDPALRFFDVGTGSAARDLGLADEAGTLAFSVGSPAGLDPQARLTWLTPVSELAGLTPAGALGSVRVRALGQSAVVDLSSAATLQDVKRLLEGANLGLRVEINASGTGIDVLSEVATGREGAMSIEEVGTGDTALRLGIRSLTPSTPLSVFNDGRGVRIIDGVMNQQTGLPDPALNIDFAVTLGNGTTFTVDLRPQDVLTAQSVVDRINAEAQAQGVAAADFTASLSGSPLGLRFTQNGAFAGPIQVVARNASPAPEMLGLVGAPYTPGPGGGVLQGQDRATVRPEGLLTHLIDLRDALRANDTNGIRVAGERLEGAIRALTEVRGVTGAFAQRVDGAEAREADRATLDLQVRSQLQDVDYAEAASRFSLLQVQLQAGLQTAASAGQRTLLDFLG